VIPIPRLYVNGIKTETAKAGTASVKSLKLIFVTADIIITPTTTKAGP